jgi:L-seryl-tRNA(Ser) seleniumtransferase
VSALPAGADLSGLPSVDRLAADPRLEGAAGAFGKTVVVDAVRAALDEARARALAGAPVPATADLVASAARLAEEAAGSRPRHVVNATGVILHTNLGRAPVSDAAAAAMSAASAQYTDLEYDLGHGERGSRQNAVRDLLCQLTGAEDALVVNNNAGATLLVLTALATGQPVLVSRGELVEIGGGFRLPEVFEAGGATLVEVGTTNRTYAADYRRAIERLRDANGATPDAGGATERASIAGATTAAGSTAAGRRPLILRVHASNFRIEGFHHRPELRELVALAEEFDAIVVDDLGSGSLLDTTAFGLAPEPTVQDSLTACADVVTFSGDKLLGGPQAGIVAGRAETVAELRRHPLARALRPGKDVFAGLRVTLLAYARGDAVTAVPVWRMIAATGESLRARAESWKAALGAADGYAVSIESEMSTVGGGSTPGAQLPTSALAIVAPSADVFSRLLRTAPTPVVARIDHGRVLLDPRTVLPGEDDAVVAALRLAMRAG